MQHFSFVTVFDIHLHIAKYAGMVWYHLDYSLAINIVHAALSRSTNTCYVRSKATRFRWIQTSGQFDADNTWALTRVYIGDECDCSCAGHGRCSHGTCVLVYFTLLQLLLFLSPSSLYDVVVDAITTSLSQ